MLGFARSKELFNVSREKLGILVGGGPAPGINSVISAATIRALLQGVEVLGIRDGFDLLMKGRLDDIRPLQLGDVSRIHFTGGSVLGTSRANPTKKDVDIGAVVDSLHRLGVTQLITIGGDDTAFSAMKVSERAAGKIRVVMPRPSTTISTSTPWSTPSATRPRATSAWNW
jgi:6-phosphofructokinase